MAYLTTQPQLLATAAADASEISSAINAAKSAAVGPTTSLATAAEDEVSAITAAFFGAYGQEYQALLQTAATFHEQFVAALAAAGSAYAQAEADIATTLGLTGSTAPAFGALTQSDPTVSAILIMSGSGTATPSTTFMQNVYNLYLSGFTPENLIPVSTPEGLYPISGVKDLNLDISLARGVTELENAIGLQITPAGVGGTGSIAVFGDSQSSIVASLAMPQLLAQGYAPSQINFTLVGNESNPNGGLLTRFPGLSIPSLGFTFGIATPSNDFPTTIWTLEYDGFADFPQYPIDIFSDLNAVAGIAFVHGTYSTLSATQVGSAITLPGSESLGTPNSMTNYELIPTQNLPLLDPLRAIPVVGKPLADLVQPDLTYLVNWGYGNPAFGYSTGPANVPTPFGFLPPLSATMALGPDLISGTQQGIGAFVGDLSAMTSASLPNLSLSSLTSLLPGAGTGGAALTLAAPASIPSTIDGIISAIQSANNNIAGGLAGDVSTAYATLLPTADIAVGLGVTLPSYDVNLFLNGIAQAFNGQPLQGLINAFGDPIAADVGLTTVGGGIELFVIVNTLETILTGTPHPGPM